MIDYPTLLQSILNSSVAVVLSEGVLTVVEGRYQE
jgi:hypothetical protein